MEISKINNGSNRSIEDKKNVTNKKDFSGSFNFAKEKRDEQQLKELIDNIIKKGNRLSVTKCYLDVKLYKDLIKEYLEGVLAYMYRIKKNTSFWQTQYFITVETIDNKLNELTESFLKGEEANLDIAGTIDDIAGLIVDIYK